MTYKATTFPSEHSTPNHEHGSISPSSSFQFLKLPKGSLTTLPLTLNRAKPAKTANQTRTLSLTFLTNKQQNEKGGPESITMQGRSTYLLRLSTGRYRDLGKTRKPSTRIPLLHDPSSGSLADCASSSRASNQVDLNHERTE